MGQFYWGFIRGIMMGFIRGIRLEDHPLRPAKMLAADAVGGSAGIPDSLGHKPGDTSGRAGWSPLLLLSTGHPFHASHLHRYSRCFSFSFYFLSFADTIHRAPIQSFPPAVAGTRPDR